jgi:hypothetical protein
MLKRSPLAAGSLVTRLTQFLGTCWRGFGGVDAVFNAQGLDCGCVNGAWKFTPKARVMYLEKKRVKTPMMRGWINSASYKWARAIGFGEGRGPTLPFGTHHVDCCVWNAWVCACAIHTRPTRGTRGELGLQINRNEKLVNNRK